MAVTARVGTGRVSLVGSARSGEIMSVILFGAVRGVVFWVVTRSVELEPAEVEVAVGTNPAELLN